MYVEGSHTIICTNILFFSLMIFQDPDKMLHFVALHVGLLCLPKHLFMGLHYTLTWVKVQNFPNPEIWKKNLNLHDAYKNE